MKRAEKFFAVFAKILGILSITFLFLLVCFVLFNVCARYFFHYGNVALQELEWYFFACMFLFGMSYTLQQDAHVRVDVIYDSLSPRKKAYINIFGVIFFLLPFALLIVCISPDFVIEAYESGETSADPGGLAYRWIIKSTIPICFGFLIISAIGFIVQNINALIQIKKTGFAEFFVNSQNSAKGV
ncbi:TRAP transporter small permease subunit [Campylobacter hominis]|uniref:TRAP transporter small permease subunit n=1 Tax=Campylobacter hominis TaxID=76517 RepID=UPI00248AE307|nr:TRAP transporter small permease subunit [Campylobacter hominis]